MKLIPVLNVFEDNNFHQERINFFIVIILKVLLEESFVMFDRA